MKNIKHIVFAVIATIMLGFASVNSAQAQIILLESDQNNNRTIADGSELPVLPGHNSTYDYYEYTPLGGSVWVLSALGLAYMAGKRKKED